MVAGGTLQREALRLLCRGEICPGFLITWLERQQLLASFLRSKEFPVPGQPLSVALKPGRLLEKVGRQQIGECSFDRGTRPCGQLASFQKLTYALVLFVGHLRFTWDTPNRAIY